MSTVLAQGAEARLERKKSIVTKKRVKKNYRHPVIDEELRRNRNKQEARLLKKARRCVKTPAVMETGEHSFDMEYIDGAPVKTLGYREDVYTRIGEVVACLHDVDVIHGDLTTSNMLLTAEEELVLIDFGLGYHSDRVEDKATDLRLLKQVLHATHPTFWETAWNTVTAAYQDHSEEGDAVLNRVEELEERGRYTA